MPPPSGTAQPVPTGTAFFEPGARRLEVHVRAAATIDKMVFGTGAEGYTFLIHPQDSLSILQDGIVDPAKVSPKFFVSGELEILKHGSAADARLEIAGLGILSLEKSAGPGAGHAISSGAVENNGRISIGTNTFTILNRFTQSSTGNLQ